MPLPLRDAEPVQDRSTPLMLMLGVFRSHRAVPLAVWKPSLLLMTIPLPEVPIVWGLAAVPMFQSRKPSLLPATVLPEAVTGQVLLLAVKLSRYRAVPSPNRVLPVTVKSLPPINSSPRLSLERVLF